MPFTVREGTLGAVLYNSRIINDADIAAALAEQQRSGRRFGEVLVSLGIVSQEDINWALSNQLEIPYVRLKREMIDAEALNLLPAHLCRTHQLIPLIRAGDELAIAIADPLNKEAITAATEASGCPINLSIALGDEIEAMIDLLYGLPTGLTLGFSSDILPAELVAASNGDTSGQLLFSSLLSHAIQHRLSSFSFRPMGERIEITARQGTVTHRLGELTAAHYPDLCRLIRTTANLTATKEPSQTGSFLFRYQQCELTFQLLVLTGNSGDYLTIRRQIATGLPSTLEELKLPPFQKRQFDLLAAQHQGLILVASRSLQERCRFIELLLEQRATEGTAVLILGDEPGRLQKRFPRIPLPEQESAEGRLIMDALEHDPDILVIEDATSLVPFTAGFRAAMRGKLVLAGMDIHGTGNLCDHLIRYQQRNAFLTPFLAGIVSLQGMQLLCPDCRRSREQAPQEMVNLRLQQMPTDLYHAVGCSRCGFTGTGERLLLTDIICFDTALRHRFEATPDGDSFLKGLYADGYSGIEANGEALLRSGAVALEEYLAAVVK